MLKMPVSWGLSTLIAATSLLAACGPSGLETCKVVDIEKPEFEVGDITDIDIERGEVEMVCGDKIVDVTWGEFNKKLGINPKDYLDDRDGLESNFDECLIDTGSKKKELQCKKSPSSDFVTVSFSYDD